MSNNSNNKNLVVKVVFPIAVDKHFDYLLPDGLSADVGMRVVVEFSRRKAVGLVVDSSSKSVVKKESLKPVISVLDSNPILTNNQLAFAKKISQHYLYSFGEIVFMMLPAVLRKYQKTQISDVNSFKQTDKCIGYLLAIYDSFFDQRFNSYKGKIKDALNQGSVVICFPIVSYLKHAEKIIKKEFEGLVEVIHSYNKPKDNFNSWQSVLNKNKIILGTRGAIISYPANLKLLIVEEENNSSYFQPEKPYYHLIDIAFMLKENSSIDLILSGTVPSLQTYKRYLDKEMKSIDLKEDKKEIRIFDLKALYSKKKFVLAPFVIELMRKSLSKNKKILILWNKKGYFRILKCNNCDEVLKCAHCSSFMRFSLYDNKKICPACGYKQDFSQLCPVCRKGYVKSFGVGIERLESIIKRIFPEYKVNQLEKAAADTKIFLSTSKVLSYLYDFKASFDSVFMLDVDSILSRTDYDSTFEAFVYLKEISKIAEKRVNLFTYNPNHYLFKDQKFNWETFYDQECNLRKTLHFPPFGTIIKMILRSKVKLTALKNAQNLYNDLEKLNLDVFGPIEEEPLKLRDFYRFCVVVKSEDDFLQGKISKVLSKYKRSNCKMAVIVR